MPDGNKSVNLSHFLDIFLNEYVDQLKFHSFKVVMFDKLLLKRLIEYTTKKLQYN